MQVYRSTREKKQEFLHLVWTGVDPSEARKRLRVDKAQALRWMQGIEDKTPKVQSRESVVLAIPDMHHPFCHPDALDFLKYVKGRFNPTTIVCLGDEIDAHAFSRYMPDPDGMSPGKELAAAIEGLMPFYREFPKVLVCESNHTVRPWKKAFEAGLPAAFLPSYSKLLNAPDGWVWKSRHVVDGVMYIHGDSGKSGAYAHQNYVKAFKKSVVIGHMHSNAGVQYDGNLFGLNTGCLIDADAYAFKYAKNMPTGVNLGCGLIIGGECAFFLPMRTDESGRWIGRL
jgi:hypothetical protein